MTRKSTQGLSLDDVERLSYGKRSSSKKGSRRIPHRLNNTERALFERAKAHGHMWSLSALNPALINTYFNFCCATGRLFISIIRTFDGSFDLIVRHPDEALKDTSSSKFESQSSSINKKFLDILIALKLSNNKFDRWILTFEDAQYASKLLRKTAVENIHES
jgi:hypothetical protein